MEQIPLQILEGLIHNVRTPLNLILGYAEHAQKHDKSEYATRIHNAGIKLDDLLQNTWNSLQQMTDARISQSLTDWIRAWEVIMNNYLHLKHSFHLELPEQLQEVQALFSGKELCSWMVKSLSRLSENVPMGGYGIRLEPLPIPALRMEIRSGDGSLPDPVIAETVLLEEDKLHSFKVQILTTSPALTVELCFEQ